MANLVVVSEGKEITKETLYIRGIKDKDGDFTVQVSRTSVFESPINVAFFTTDTGTRKLRIVPYCGLNPIEDLVEVEDGKIVGLNPIEDLIEVEDGKIVLDL
jgi:hypothetical protein